MKETSHVYTQCVILTWRSWWKTPVFVLAPLQLPCLRGDVTQSREMNWVNLNRWVGLTKQRRDEWWFTVAAVWPARLRISWELERISLSPKQGLWFMLSCQPGSQVWSQVHQQRHSSDDWRECVVNMSKISWGLFHTDEEAAMLVSDWTLFYPAQFLQRAFRVVVFCPPFIWQLYNIDNRYYGKQGGEGERADHHGETKFVLSLGVFAPRVTDWWC